MAMIGVWSVASDATAEIVVAVAPPVAIRGGDLVVPLASTDPTDEWPETVVATVDGVETEASVVWLVPRGLEGPRWTSPQTPVAIVDRGEDEPTIGNALAVIRVPEEGDGPIELLGSTWTPRRVQARLPFPGDRSEATSLGPDADPPLDDPMEWFRWAIRADLEQARSLEHFGGHHLADVGRDGHRREGADGVMAKDDFVRENDAGDWRVERGRDG